MELNRFENLTGITTDKVGGQQPRTERVQPGGPSFDETLKGLQSGNIPPAVSEGFGQSLVFSKHAVERMQSRGIGMSPEKMQRLEGAFAKAQGKGSKNTLVLMDDSAFIMSVKNKTIVTAMDKANMKENLFTNIDSTIMV